MSTQKTESPLNDFLGEDMRNSRGEDYREKGARDDIWSFLLPQIRGTEKEVTSVSVLEKMRKDNKSWRDIYDMLCEYGSGDYPDLYSGIEYFCNKDDFPCRDDINGDMALWDMYLDEDKSFDGIQYVLGLLEQEHGHNGKVMEAIVYYVYHEYQQCFRTIYQLLSMRGYATLSREGINFLLDEYDW